MGTGDGDDLAALIGRFRSLVHGRIPDDEFRRGIDLVRNRVRIGNLVHIAHDDKAGDGVVRDDELQFVAVLAHEFRDVHTAQDHFLHVVQVLALHRDDIAGEDLRRSEGIHFDGFSELQVRKGLQDGAVLGDDGHLAHHGALEWNHDAQFTVVAGLGDVEVGHGDAAVGVGVGTILQEL